MTTILAWYAAASVSLIWLICATVARRMLKTRKEMQKMAIGMTGLFARTNDPNKKLWEIDGEQVWRCREFLPTVMGRRYEIGEISFNSQSPCYGEIIFGSDYQCQEIGLLGSC